jgi:hypothetical protein
MKWPRILLVAGLILLLSFIRENTFLVLNGAINNTNSYKAYIAIPEFLHHISNHHLLLIKWLLTFFFLLGFMLLTMLLITDIFNTNKFKDLVMIVYIVVTSLCLLAFAISQSIAPDFYPVSIGLLSLTQTPVLTMFLIIYIFIVQKDVSEET